MGKIYVIMGKSASGKDTVYGEVKAMLPSLRGFVMYTTRPMRSGEEDGVSYHFVTPGFVEAAEKNGTLIEKRVYDTVYGPWIYATIDDGQIDPSKGDYLVPGTLESYLKLRDHFGSDTVIPVYIEVEDGERLLRAIGREKTQKPPRYAEMCRRFLADCEDFSEEKLAEAGIQRRFENRDSGICAAMIADMIRGN